MTEHAQEFRRIPYLRCTANITMRPWFLTTAWILLSSVVTVVPCELVNRNGVTRTPDKTADGKIQRSKTMGEGVSYKLLRSGTEYSRALGTLLRSARQSVFIVSTFFDGKFPVIVDEDTTSSKPVATSTPSTAASKAAKNDTQILPLSIMLAQLNSSVTERYLLTSSHPDTGTLFTSGPTVKALAKDQWAVHWLGWHRGVNGWTNLNHAKIVLVDETTFIIGGIDPMSTRFSPALHDRLGYDPNVLQERQDVSVLVENAPAVGKKLRERLLNIGRTANNARRAFMLSSSLQEGANVWQPESPDGSWDAFAPRGRADGSDGPYEEEQLLFSLLFNGPPAWPMEKQMITRKMREFALASALVPSAAHHTEFLPHHTGSKYSRPYRFPFLYLELQYFQLNSEQTCSRSPRKLSNDAAQEMEASGPTSTGVRISGRAASSSETETGNGPEGDEESSGSAFSTDESTFRQYENEVLMGTKKYSSVANLLPPLAPEEDPEDGDSTESTTAHTDDRDSIASKSTTTSEDDELLVSEKNGNGSSTSTVEPFPCTVGSAIRNAIALEQKQPDPLEGPRFSVAVTVPYLNSENPVESAGTWRTMSRLQEDDEFNGYMQHCGRETADEVTCDRLAFFQMASAFLLMPVDEQMDASSSLDEQSGLVQKAESPSEEDSEAILESSRRPELFLQVDAEDEEASTSSTGRTQAAENNITPIASNTEEVTPEPSSTHIQAGASKRKPRLEFYGVYVHTKMLVDEASALVSSANVNSRSLAGTGDFEAGIYLPNCAHCAEESVFEYLRRNTCNEGREDQHMPHSLVNLLTICSDEKISELASLLGGLDLRETHIGEFLAKSDVGTSVRGKMESLSGTRIATFDNLVLEEVEKILAKYGNSRYVSDSEIIVGEEAIGQTLSGDQKMKDVVVLDPRRGGGTYRRIPLFRGALLRRSVTHQVSFEEQDLSWVERLKLRLLLGTPIPKANVQAGDDAHSTEKMQNTRTRTGDEEATAVPKLAVSLDSIEGSSASSTLLQQGDESNIGSEPSSKSSTTPAESNIKGHSTATKGDHHSQTDHRKRRSVYEVDRGHRRGVFDSISFLNDLVQ
ncbi:unnamed protein product [Amoebophrya sp. A25]|nr:unnamed protein product [Amoebophrya sp. A25]|eukprot:GSA25T00002302001.1